MIHKSKPLSFGCSLASLLFLLIFPACSRNESPAKGSPFLESLRRNDANAVKELIKKGADINQSYKDGGSLLYWLASGGYVDAAKIAIDNGADVNKPDDHGRTPLHEASINGRVNMVKLLIERGANPNARDDRGNTPLMEASLTNHNAVVVYLLQHGAMVNEKNQSKETALSLASRAKNEEVKQTLICSGAKVEDVEITNLSSFPGQSILSIVTLLSAFFLFILYLGANWRMYTLLGEHGWASLIPVYDMLVLFKFADKPWWWIFLWVIPFIGVFTWIPVIKAIVKRLEKPRWHGWVFFFFRPLYIIYLAFPTLYRLKG
jgi:hypothetical protein